MGWGGPVGAPEDGIVADVGDLQNVCEVLGEVGFAGAACADDDNTAAGGEVDCFVTDS